MPADLNRLLVISNRAPYSIRRRGRQTELSRTVGGLATTLDDTLRSRGGTWLAWSGNVSRVSRRRKPVPPFRSISGPGIGYRLRLLNLTESQVADYYHGFSNRALWPLCHYFPGNTRFDEDEWKTYEAVNRLFARAAARIMPSGGLAWVHDFHLTLVPSTLRALRPDARIAVFWHIPFPCAAVFRINPWAREIVSGLLGSDLIGFHTREYARHFVETAVALLDVKADLECGQIEHGGRVTRVAAFPLGIEARTFERYAADRRTLAAADRIRRAAGHDLLLLGVDRLDYTKGILERLRAYERLLAENPALHRKVCLVQIQVPSRENVPEYRALRVRIDEQVGRIAGRFSTAGWVPIRYLCQSFTRRELVAYYRAANILLVTALRDGMNLVAHEFVATRTDDDGVLVLSQFAGAAERLHDAILVNPYDVNGMARAMHRAIHMRAAERHAAMRAMRKKVVAEDVDWWLASFLSAAAEEPRREPRGRRRSRAPA